MTRRIWIGWEKHRRNQSCSRAFSASLYEIDYGGGRLSRYWRSSLKTLAIIRNERADEIYCQNPSIVLTLLCLLVGRVHGTPVIVDAHNAALLPLSGKNPIARWLSKIWIGAAHAVIVTNNNLAQLIEKCSGTPVVLPDPLPSIAVAETHGNSTPVPPDAIKVLFICSWADDEPYREVIEAAALLPDRYSVAISGNYEKVNITAADKGMDAVNLLGYLSDEEFDRVLYESDIILDLTDREDCLLCGAYEAVACGKPMVLSDTRALRQYFGDSAEFTDNSATSIAACIQIVAEDYERFRRNVTQARRRIDKNWDELFTIASRTIAT